MKWGNYLKESFTVETNYLKPWLKGPAKKFEIAKVRVSRCSR